MSDLDLTAERLVRLRRVTALDTSPCGRWMAVEVQQLSRDEDKYVSQLWRVPLDGGPPRQLTFDEAGAAAPCFRRDGALGFISKRPRPGARDDDKPLPQVWLLPPGQGEPHPLTDEPIGVEAFRFPRHSDRLFVLASIFPDLPFEEQREEAKRRREKGPSMLRYDRSPVRFWDHWLPREAPHLVMYDDGERVDLTPEADREHRNAEWDVASDGSRVVITTARPGPNRLDDVGLLLIDCVTGEERQLAMTSGGRYGQPCFAPDDRRIAALFNRPSVEALGPIVIRLVSLEGGEPRDLTALDGWPTIGPWLDDDRLLFAVDHKARVPLFALSVATGAVERLTSESAGGAHSAIRVLPEGAGIVGLRSSFVHPPEPFRLDPVGGEPVICAALSGIDETACRRCARLSEHWVTAPDGTPLQTWLIEPPEGCFEGPRPGLLWVHGGPMSAWSDSWHWRWNAFIAAAQGYVVCMPNPRGSTGFGRDLLEGIWPNAWGGPCYEDVMALADWFVGLPQVAEHRVAAMGASFGGYMMNWLGVNTDRFRCIVNHAGIVSMTAFHGTTDDPAWFALEMGTTPYEDPEAFERYSPLRRITAWRTPALILHGEKDYRVPISEALLLFEALQHQGVPSELVVFPDENHWIQRPQNILAWHEVIYEFLRRYMGDPA